MPTREIRRLHKAYKWLTASRCHCSKPMGQRLPDLPRKHSTVAKPRREQPIEIKAVRGFNSVQKGVDKSYVIDTLTEHTSANRRLKSLVRAQQLTHRSPIATVASLWSCLACATDKGEY